MKHLHLTISLSLLILVSSCDSFYKLTPGYWKWRSEFKKEREFVQKILDNPDKMQEIIETSEFYDKDVFDLESLNYHYWIECFMPDRDGTKSKIIGFNRTSLDDGKGKMIYDNAKSIYVFSPNAEFNISFVFIESGDRTLLAYLIRVSKW